MRSPLATHTRGGSVRYGSSFAIKLVRARPFGDDDIAALTEVVRSGHVGKGPKGRGVQERAFAARHGVKHAIAVTSGTAAMHVCIAAINPEPGDEVIVTPWTAGGTIMGALLQNCVPVFA